MKSKDEAREMAKHYLREAARLNGAAKVNQTARRAQWSLLRCYAAICWTIEEYPGLDREYPTNDAEVPTGF